MFGVGYAYNCLIFHRKSSLYVDNQEFDFLDPCPSSMRHLNIGELATNDISWRMMTPFRPEDARDENVFSR